MSQGKKSKITCYGCQASYMVDLAKVPPELKAFKCLKCGGEIPILARVLPSAHSPESAPAPQPAPAPTPPPAAQGADELDLELDRGRGEAFPAEEGEAWLAIYGDMMSLLLVFFVLMFAISTIDKHKFDTVVEAVSQALGGNLSFQSGGPPGPGASGAGPAAQPALPPDPLAALKANMRQEDQSLDQLQNRLRGLVEQDQMQKSVAVRNEPKGVAIIVQDMAMFDSGSAEIKPEIRPLLLRLGNLLRGLDNEIVVEGHTDNLPISTARFASNWELSVGRATNVVHFLLEQAKLDPARITAAGYAFFRPRHAFDSPDNAKNRRIEIVVQRKYDTQLIMGLPGSQPSVGAGTR